jgi:hypothetical protein
MVTAKNITGDLVYSWYADAQITENNCEVEAWDDLYEEEKKAWEGVAYAFIRYIGE